MVLTTAVRFRMCASWVPTSHVFVNLAQCLTVTMYQLAQKQALIQLIKAPSANAAIVAATLRGKIMLSNLYAALLPCIWSKQEARVCIFLCILFPESKSLAWLETRTICKITSHHWLLRSWGFLPMQTAHSYAENKLTFYPLLNYCIIEMRTSMLSKGPCSKCKSIQKQSQV